MPHTKASGGGASQGHPPAPLLADRTRTSEGGECPSYLIHRNKSVHVDNTGLTEYPQIQELLKLPDRIARYGKARHRARMMALHLDALDTSEARQRGSKLEQCGSLLEFRLYPRTFATRLAAARFCKQDRLCPLCAIRRGAKHARAYGDKLLSVIEETPTLRPYMLTITTKNGSDLLERCDHYWHNWQRLLERRRNALKGRTISALSRISGGVSSIEIKRGKGSHEWHVHSHAIILGPGDLARDDHQWPDLSNEWHALTGDSFIVDLRPIRSTPTDTEKGITDAYAADLCEVFKYALKFSELTLEDNWHADQLLRGKRLVRPFGNLFGVPEPADLLDELLPADEPYYRLLYDFVALEGRYHAHAPFLVHPRL